MPGENVCEGSFWITCLAAFLDKCSPPLIGPKAKGAIVFDELVLKVFFAEVINYGITGWIIPGII